MTKMILRGLKRGFALLICLFLIQSFTLAEAKPKKAEVSAVRPEIVCMVNDSVMGKPQIPVVFEGRTYYGCCEGCVERIKTDRVVRYAKDPLTGKEVDKAEAVIVAGPEGEALYFESMATAAKYNASTGVR